MRTRKGRVDDGVVTITAAPENVSTDIDRRQRRYILSMTVRTLCFIAAVFVVSIPWLCGALIAASFVLPYIAVVIANSAAPRGDQPLLGPGHSPFGPTQELGPGSPSDR